jgi:hypothetical protein
VPLPRVPAARDPVQPGVTARATPLLDVFGRREPNKREIRERAYYIYLARGGVNGDPVSDWLQAERELRAELVTRRPASPRF